MAPPKATAEAPDTATDAATVEIDTTTLFRLVIERLRLLSPAGVTNPRLVWEIPGNTVSGSLPLVSLDPKLSDLAAGILAELRKVNGWVNGPALALMVDDSGELDPASGSFKRAVDELKASGLIESGRKGYQAKQ